MVCFKVLKVTKLRYVRLSYSEAYSLLTFVGDSAVVGVIASHQCGTGWIPGPGVICGLSLLLVLYSAPRGFSPVFKFHFDPGMHGNFKRVLVNSWCSVRKQITFIFTFTFYILGDASLTIFYWRDSKISYQNGYYM